MRGDGQMDDKPRIALGGLGGTISMVSAAPETRVLPRLRADELVAGVPGLAERAEVRAHTLATLPGASLVEADLLRALVWSQEQVAAGADGVVLVQGTDTLEETSYLLDLWWPHPQPLVVTGAMRPPAAAGADGPANLLAAVTTAGFPGARGRGVLVVLDDTVHAAARVAKRDSLATGAFTSPGFGPVARLVEGVPHFAADPVRHPALPVPFGLDVDAPRVALLTTHLGDDGHLLRLVAQDGYGGIVIAGYGVGHVSAGLAEVVEEVTARLPVVLATRTGSGPTAAGTYGFPGSETDLLRRGALGAGWLSPVKARVLLSVLLRLGYEPTPMADEIAARGALLRTAKTQ